MRHAIVVAVLLATGAACADDARKASLEQVLDARPGPVPDGAVGDALADSAGDSATAAETSDADGDGSEVDGGPNACGADGECGASVCTRGRCADGVCVLDPAPNGTACDDGNACTPVDACHDARCAGSGQLTCGDQDPCTDDRCTPTVGCEFAPKVCDDDDACTSDACRPGVGCVSSPLTCPPSDEACQVSHCDSTVGCLAVAAADGAACDDGRVCTIDTCLGGVCSGAAIGCDDGNPCTSDECVAEGGCNFIPIAGCANDESCLGRLPGAACDDADPGTSADMCMAGNCRGYALTRTAGTIVSGEQGMVVSEIDDGPEGWSAVLWTVDILTNQSWLLANVSAPASPALHTNTLQGVRIAGLRDGFAGDHNGRLWRLDGGHWSNDGAWDHALGASGRAAVNAIFTVHGAAVGDARTRLVWVVGGDDAEWLRLCKQQGQSVVCSAQILGNAEGDPVPRAIAGVPTCGSSGDCTGAALVVGADGWLGGGFNYTDVFENPTGLAATWQAGHLPDAPAARATRAIGAWSDEAEGLRFLVVGDNGYLLARRGDGSWRGPLGLRDGQASRDFSGVWVGGGVIVVSAHRLGSNAMTVYELWVAPVGSDLEDGDSWIVHELGRHPDVEAAGLYDVAGRSDGEVRVVGAVRRANDLFAWLDGATWVRSP